MWSPLALSPPRSVAPARTSSTHQSLRFGGTWIPIPGINQRASATSRFMWRGLVMTRERTLAFGCCGWTHTKSSVNSVSVWFTSAMFT